MRYSTFTFVLLFSGFLLAQSMEFETPMFAPQEMGAGELGKSWSCAATDPLQLTEKQEAICTYLNIRTSKKEKPLKKRQVSKKRFPEKNKKR